MPPKRRKTSSSAEPPQPNKRITRSSTRRAEHSSTQSTTPKQAISGAKRKAKSTTITTPKSKDTNKDVESDTTEHVDIIPLTISSPLVKKPIVCHHYTTSELPTSDPQPTLIFTHGAGGTLSAPAVTNFCNGFSSLLPVFAFQGSMNLTARTKAFQACISHIQTLDQESAKPQKCNANVQRLLLGGRSMGARAAAIAASTILSSPPQDTDIRPRIQLILVSYPLKGPKDIRDDILLGLPKHVDLLFVIGERDAMCPLDMLEDVRRKMSASSRLVVVRGTDHGMGGGGKAREREVGEEAGRVAARWVVEGIYEEVVYVGVEG